jgi:hypothetical protein
MAITKLRHDAIESFLNEPEVGMGIQVGKREDNDEFVLVISAQTAAIIDDEAIGQLSELRQRYWLSRDADWAQQISDFEQWRRGLPPSRPIIPVPPAIAAVVAPLLVRGFKIGPDAIPSPPPKHLPFQTVTGGDDVFYRWEPYPTSRRVLQSSSNVLPETYAAPYSEAQFVPTGFGAVGRFALPSVFPACWRWEIQPNAGTQIRCGASIPLFGQSGGGVEVMFPNGAINRGPIANPVVLPIL